MNGIIVDTDPGIDDAIALVVLLAKKKEYVKAVLSSYGNISVAKTTKNANSILNLCNCDIPLIMGTKAPNNDNYVEATHIHGEDGLGGLSIETTDREVYEGDFLQKIYDIIIKEGIVDYIVLGPLTNLALLIKRFPDVLTHIGKVTIMGGGFDMGNITQYAEFNIHCDAESADYVFKNVKNIFLAPLNATTPVAFSLEEISELENVKTKMSKACIEILTTNYYNYIKYGESGSTMHDATAIIYYLNPDLFLNEICSVNVSCDSSDSCDNCDNEHYGMTFKVEGDNIAIATKCDSKTIKNYITNCIKSY